LPIPDLFVHYDYDYNFNISKYINDPDNETHELDIWTLNTEHIRFDASDSTLMILNYPESLVGQTFWVTLNVSDGIEITWTQFQVHVTDNYPPILKKNLADVHFNEDSGLQHAINLLEYFDDEDDVELDFSYNLVDEENITIEFNPGNTVDFSSKKDWYGSSFISFRAEDSSNAFIDTGINIVVIPVNDPPAVNQIPNQTGKMGERWVLDLTPYLFDVDNNVSELEITCDNEFVIVTGKQLTFFGDKKANTEVEFIVSDGYLNSTGIISLNIAKSEQQKTQDVMQIIWFFLIIIALIIVGMLLAVVRKRRGNFIITDVFLIHQNGVLIKYLGDTLKKDSDEDIISGMLTAVQSFISDSFAGGAKDEADGWSLNQLRMGKHEIMFEHGEYIYITVIYKGNPGRRLSLVLSETVTKVEKDFGKTLAKWNGNYALLNGIEKIVKPLITSKKPATKPKKKVIPEIPMPLKSEKVEQIQQPQLKSSPISTSQPEPQSQPPAAQKTGSHILSMSQIAQLPPHQPQLAQPSSTEPVHQTSVELSKKLPKRSPPKSPDQPTQQYYAQIPSHISSQSSVQSNQVNKDSKL